MYLPNKMKVLYNIYDMFIASQYVNATSNIIHEDPLLHHRECLYRFSDSLDPHYRFF